MLSATLALEEVEEAHNATDAIMTEAIRQPSKAIALKRRDG
jgi:hypothetical protein